MSRLGGAGAVAQLVADIPLSVTVFTLCINFLLCLKKRKLGLLIIFGKTEET